MPPINERDMKQIMQRFPQVELSYDKITHKKVSTDFCIAIPYGKKCFAWFTYYKSFQTCIILETTRDHKICVIFYMPCSFHPDLSLNTLVFGTMLPNKPFFIIEDIFYYKNNNVSSQSNKQKLELLQNMFKNDIKQVSFSTSDIIMGLPVMRATYNEIQADIVNLPYNIYCVQFRSFNNNKLRLNYINNTKPPCKAIFKIMATIDEDIYNLFIFDKGAYEHHNIALVPTYKCSIMMNSFFRNIKENINLDALEESDDEEEFENISADKFVDLEKSHFIECEFSHKFRKWIPLKLVKTNRTIMKRQLQEYEK